MKQWDGENGHEPDNDHPNLYPLWLNLLIAIMVILGIIGTGIAILVLLRDMGLI